MLNIAATVDIGLVRDKNDDRILLNNEILSDGRHRFISPTDDLLAVVCDGVGGENYGNEAAQTVVETMAQLADVKSNVAILKEMIKLANQKNTGYTEYESGICPNGHYDNRDIY